MDARLNTRASTVLCEIWGRAMKVVSTVGNAAAWILLAASWTSAQEQNPAAEFSETGDVRATVKNAWVGYAENSGAEDSTSSESNANTAACIAPPPAAFSLQESFGIHDSQWFVRGHLQQGANVNSRRPVNPPGGFGNLPSGGLVYRADEYMLNQAYVSFGRATDTSHGDFDVGGQVDFMYGTDYVFLSSRGLEKERDGSNKWNGDHGSGLGGVALQGLALPQMYAEFAYDTVTVQIGHFYNVFGLEENLPVKNFYYTIDYTGLYNGYGESDPVTGLFAQWQMSPHWKVGAGLHRGQNKWEDNNNVLNFVGLVEWTKPSKDMILTYTFDVGAEDDLGQNTVFAQSLIFEWQFTEKTSYVLHSSYGFEENVATGGGTAYWYGFTNYLTHELHKKLLVGMRYGWFNDVDGTRVFPRAGFPANAPGAYNGLTFGLNYLPHKNVTIRPEVRWDWFDAHGALPPGPFDGGTNRNQFMAAVDLVISF